MSVISRITTYVKLLILVAHRSSIKSDRNAEVVCKLVKEVKGLNPSFDGANIRGMLISMG